jgi:hypothetical protein
VASTANHYARISVDDIVPGFEDLELDFPTPEGHVRLGDVKRHTFYGKRNTSCFQAQRQGHRLQGIQVHPSPVNIVHLRRPRVHLRLRISRRRPRVHLGHRVSQCRPPSAPLARQPTPTSSAPPARQAKPPPNTTQKGKSGEGPLRLVLLIR